MPIVSARCAVVLMIDGLGAGFLGPYGNTWIETPAWNRLAAGAFLCEHPLIDSPVLTQVYRSFLCGCHAICPESAELAREFPALPAALSGQGISSTLLSDDPAVIAQPLAQDFSRVISVPCPEASHLADEADQTQLARLFAAVTDALDEQSPGSLLWIHARGMTGPWDAPREFRAQFADEDEPVAEDLMIPPRQILATDYDPDELLPLVHAYAGQVVLLDMCLEALLQALDQHPLRDQTLLIVTSSRGYPLGEHRCVGGADEVLYGETLHVPLVVRLPSGEGALLRSQALVQPPDLCATLRDWFGGDVPNPKGFARSLLPLARDDISPDRDRAVAILGQERIIRTPAWQLRVAPPESQTAPAAQRVELFAKPDDQWEVNEVSDRCPEVADRLKAALAEFEQLAQANDFSPLSPLDELLIAGME